MTTLCRMFLAAFFLWAVPCRADYPPTCLTAFYGLASEEIPMKLITDTFRRLHTEVRERAVREKHLREFERMLAERGWKTPEVNDALARTFEELKIASQSALHRLAGSAAGERPRFLNCPGGAFEVSPDGRWVLYGAPTPRLFHLATGEDVPAGVPDRTPRQWRTVKFSADGRLLAYAGEEPGGVTFIPLRDGTARQEEAFTLGVPPKPGFIRGLFSAKPEVAEVTSVIPTPSADLWLTASGPDYRLLDAGLRKVVPITFAELGVNRSQIDEIGVVPHTDRLYFLISDGARPVRTVVTARLHPDGRLEDVKPLPGGLDPSATDSGKAVWNSDGTKLALGYAEHGRAKISILEPGKEAVTVALDEFLPAGWHVVKAAVAHPNPDLVGFHLFSSKTPASENGIYWYSFSGGWMKRDDQGLRPNEQLKLTSDGAYLLDRSSGDRIRITPRWLER